MKFVFGGESDIGNTRQDNQDSLLIKMRQIGTHTLLLGVICDGVGSFQCGELASVAVTLWLRAWFDEIPPEPPPIFAQLSQELLEQLHQLNRQISNYARQSDLQTGTTVSTLLIYDDRFAIAHIGDSRIYKIDTHLSQLTRDHAVLRPVQTRNGKINKRYLTQCVGMREHLDPFYGAGYLCAGEGYLLCSDGFYEQLDAKQLLHTMKKITEKTDLDALARSLIGKVLKQSGHDNISLGMIKILPE